MSVYLPWDIHSPQNYLIIHHYSSPGARLRWTRRATTRGAGASGATAGLAAPSRLTTGRPLWWCLTPKVGASYHLSQDARHTINDGTSTWHWLNYGRRPTSIFWLRSFDFRLNFLLNVRLDPTTCDKIVLFVFAFHTIILGHSFWQILIREKLFLQSDVLCCFCFDSCSSYQGKNVIIKAFSV